MRAPLAECVAVEKLEKFEGEYEPGKEPVEVIEEGVGNDSVGLRIDDALKILREIDQVVAERWFPNNGTPPATESDMLRLEILILATTIDRELRALPPTFASLEAAEKDWRKKLAGTSENARKGVRRAEVRYKLMRAGEWLRRSAAALSEGRTEAARTEYHDAASMALECALDAPSRMKQQRGKIDQRKAERRPDPRDQDVLAIWDLRNAEYETEVHATQPAISPEKVASIAGKRLRKQIMTELEFYGDSDRKHVLHVLERGGRISRPKRPQ
jgi:hypothetical protein